MEQVIANVLISASRYVLVALGLFIIYRTSRCLDFSQGANYALGAYLSYLLASLCRLPLPLAITLGVVGVALVGGSVERFIYDPIRRRTGTALAVMLASLGILVVIQNCISLVFGDLTRSLRHSAAVPGLTVLSAKVTVAQLILVGASLVLCALLWLLIRRTRWGMMIAAVASNPDLATAVGVPSRAVLLRTASLGSSLSALAGALVSLDVDMQPGAGTEALLAAVLVVLLVGIGRPAGLFVASLLLASFEGLAGARLSLLWREAIAFAAVLVLLGIRPHGLGKANVRDQT